MLNSLLMLIMQKSFENTDADVSYHRGVVQATCLINNIIKLQTDMSTTMVLSSHWRRMRFICVISPLLCSLSLSAACIQVCWRKPEPARCWTSTQTQSLHPSQPSPHWPHSLASSSVLSVPIVGEWGQQGLGTCSWGGRYCSPDWSCSFLQVLKWSLASAYCSAECLTAVFWLRRRMQSWGGTLFPLCASSC